MESKRLPSACFRHFKILISSIRTPKDLKPETLRSLYYELAQFCVEENMTWVGYKAASEFLSVEFDIKFKDIHNVSNVLFTALSAKFEEFFGVISIVSTKTWVSGQSSFHMNLGSAIKDMTLLLRCCLVIPPLLVFDQRLCAEKCLVILKILKRLLSLEVSVGGKNSSTSFNKSISRECTRVSDGCKAFVVGDLVTFISFAELSDPCRALSCAILEVFADELSIHKSVLSYFSLVDSMSLATELLFKNHTCDIEFASVLEVITGHFLLSVSEEQAFENFLNRLVWQHESCFRVPEMSFTAALALLFHPVMSSAPKLFQAHVISLVSDVIGISMSYENIMSDSRRKDHFLSAFERSIILYGRHMSTLQKNGYPIAGDSPFLKSCNLESGHLIDFESYLQPSTRVKVRQMITKCDNFWESYLAKISSKTKDDLIVGSIVYTKESLSVSEESFREEILSIVSCIILRGSSDDADDFLLQNKKDSSPQDFYLLASILKLMSTSMFQVLCCLRLGRNSTSWKTMKDVSSSEKFDVLLGMLDCFQQFSICLPIQTFLNDIMELQPMRHKNSKWMLLHFSGLLSLSYISGLEFMVKGCIFTLMMLLNLFIFEEGDLDALSISLLRSGTESSPCKAMVEVQQSKSRCEVRKDLVVRKSTNAVALEFQKIRTLYLGSSSATNSNKKAQARQPACLENAPYSLDRVESALTVEEYRQGTCNGAVYLQHVLQGKTRASDIDDLADFIECKEGKDYIGWLKNKEKFRRWKCEKWAKVRWKKKRRAWNLKKR